MSEQFNLNVYLQPAEVEFIHTVGSFAPVAVTVSAPQGPQSMTTYLTNGQPMPASATTTSRVWKGDDATYYVMELDQYFYSEPPFHPGQKVFRYQAGMVAPEEWVVREIAADFRKMVWTVSCIDAISWDKSMRLLPGRPSIKPPRFASVEEADAWLEEREHG